MSDWITDRPPKDGDTVLITYIVPKNGNIFVDAAYVYISFINKEVQFLDNGTGVYGYGAWGKEVIAWKPLPKPYEPND